MKASLTPCDICTLACLGYISLQRPTYKIIAKHWTDDDETVVFALQCSASKTIITKTAIEISNDKPLLASLSAEEAHQVGYTLATEHIQQEKRLMQQINEPRN
jgi:hypothetical protein